MRFLDVGCGWGSLSLHAAEHYGAQVTGVTIAAEQKQFIDAGSASAGSRTGSRSGSRTTARSPRRRSRASTPSPRSRWASTSASGTTATYAAGPARRREARRAGADPADVALRWTDGHPGGGPFIESLHRARHAHAAGRRDRRATSSAGGSRCATCTRCASTTCAPSQAGWRTSRPTSTGSTELVGEEVVRVWRLYLVGGAMAFRDGRMGVDQILMVRPGGGAHAARRASLVSGVTVLLVARCASLRAVAVADDGHRARRPPGRPRRRRRRRLGPGLRAGRAGVRRCSATSRSAWLLLGDGRRVGAAARLAHRQRRSLRPRARTRATRGCSATAASAPRSAGSS